MTCAEVLHPRHDAVFDDDVERRRGIHHLARHKPVDGASPIGKQALHEQQEVSPETLFRGLPPSRFTRQVGRLSYAVRRRLQDRAIEPELVAEMIVDRRDVRSRVATDFTNRDVFKPRSANNRSPALRSRARVSASAATADEPASLSSATRRLPMRNGRSRGSPRRRPAPERESRASRSRRLMTSV